MGLTRYEYLERFDRMNLLFHFPGKRQSGDKFSIRDAKLAANAIRPLLVDRRVVLVGRNVANAFGLQEEEFHEWTTLQVRRYCPIQKCRGLARIACVPHPSGRNHWYNDAENLEAARRFWEELLQEDKKVLSFAAAQRI